MSNLLTSYTGATGNDYLFYLMQDPAHPEWGNFFNTAQGFQVASKKDVDKVSGMFAKYTNSGAFTGGTITAKIYGDTSGEPGTLLATSSTTINVASLTSTATFYDFTFSPVLSLLPATQYWVVFQADTNIAGTNLEFGDSITVKVSYSDDYSDGIYAPYYEGMWHPYSGQDMNFKIWGEDTPLPVITIGSSSTSGVYESQVSLTWTSATISTVEDLEYMPYYSINYVMDTVADVINNGTEASYYWMPAGSTVTIPNLFPDVAYYFNVLVRDAATQTNVVAYVKKTANTTAALPTYSWSSVGTGAVGSSGKYTYELVNMCSSADGSILYAIFSISTQEYIYKSIDNGVSWTATGSPSKNWGCIACSADGSKLVAGVNLSGTTGTIWTSSFYGDSWSWTERASAGDIGWSQLACSSDGTKVYAGSTSTSYTYLKRSTDSGATWTECTALGTGAGFRGLACSYDGVRVIASNAVGGNQASTSMDGGVTWVSRAVGNHSWSRFACSSDMSTIVIASNFGDPLKTSTDFGATWQSREVNWTNNVSGLVCSDDGQRMALSLNGGGGYDNRLRTSGYSGAVWKDETPFNTAGWGCLAANRACRKLHGASNTMFTGSLSSSSIPTDVTSVVTVPNTGGTIILTEDMTVTATGDLTLDVAKVSDLAGGKIITVQPGGKIKLTAGRQITVVAGTRYKLKT